MKVAVVAGDISKQELLSRTVPSFIEYIWIDAQQLCDSPGADACFDLDFVPSPERINWLKQFFPRPIFINAVTHTLGTDSEFFIRINAWPGFLQRPVCEIAVANVERKKVAMDFLETLGWSYHIVPDIAGMITPRIVSMIVNEAYYTLGAGVSSRQEIDIAMKLGTNYPWGPFEWSEKIGLKNIAELLRKLGKTDERYCMAETLEAALIQQ